LKFKTARWDYLTVREIARLQGFEDDFIFYGSESSQRMDVLRGIPPTIAQHVARAIRQAIDGMRVITVSRGNEVRIANKRPRLDN
jgi:site-specific DNA-cytosine methylase